MNKRFTQGLVIVVGAAVFASAMSLSALRAQQTPATQPAAKAVTQPADPNKVVITAGDQKVTAGEFNSLVESVAGPRAAEISGAQKYMLAEQLADVKLLVGEAKKRNLDQSAKFKQRLEFLKDQLLAQSLVEEIADDAAAKKYYDEHTEDYASVKTRHILIPTEGSPMATDGKGLPDAEAKAKADEFRKRIKEGEDFDKVSKSPGAGGGDLPAFTRNSGRVPPSYESAAFALKANEVSDLVKTQFGYHLIQAQSHTAQPFEAVKEEIKNRLGPEKVETLMKELKAKNPVTIDESFFGPKPATLPMGPVGPMGPGGPMPGGE